MLRWGILVGLLAVACGSADTSGVFGPKVCVPGATQECACPGGVKGAQACREDGAGFDACACGGGSGSGGSAGGGGDSGSSGAGGSCSPRTACPVPESDGGAALCGQLDNYCGGKLSCGCDFGDCSGGLCQCWPIAAEYGAACTNFGYPGIAVACSAGVLKPRPSCMRSPVAAGTVFPDNAYCCGPN
jgi:hypothetical protein